jgi:hypothetical protein
MLVHRQSLSRRTTRFNRDYKAVSGLDRPEDAPGHGRRTWRVGQ